MTIFISYRRDDEDAAGRLVDALRVEFGDEAVFQDTALRPGDRWGDALRAHLDAAEALIVVIGPHWLVLTDSKTGRRRLEIEDDWVRLEITRALTRRIPIFPVLIANARQPDREELPAELQELMLFTTHSLRTQQWDTDIKGLIAAMRAKLKNADTRRARARRVAPEQPSGADSVSVEEATSTTGIGWALNELGKGDRVLVIGRTCHHWLAGRQHAPLQEALEAGVQITFVVQDLYDYLADQQFAALSKDLNEARAGYETLLASLSLTARPLLALRFCPTEIRNGRTIVYRQEVPVLVRYDLSMEPGIKPSVLIKGTAMATPISIEATMLERESIPLPDYNRLRNRRRVEEDVRMAVQVARERFPFGSATRANAPERLVKRWAQLRVLTETPEPVSVQLLLTPSCTTHCAMCSYYTHSTGGALSTASFKRLLDDVVNMGIRAATLSGGEPLAVKDIEEILLHASPKLQLGVLTSGIVPANRRETVSRAVASHCQWAQVSVDSFRELDYRRIRSADNSARLARLQTCSEFLRELKRESSLRLEVCYTIQSANVDELLDPEALIASIRQFVPAGVPVRFKFATGQPGVTLNGRAPAPEFRISVERLRRLSYAWNEYKAALSAAGCNATYILAMLDQGLEPIAAGYPMESLWRRLATSPCHAVSYSMFIDFNGDVYPCCYLYNDNVADWPGRKGFVMENWAAIHDKRPNENALQSIWLSPVYRAARERKLGDLPREACGRCTRHMSQNAFLEELTAATASVKIDAIDRAVSVFKDPRDLRFPPMWL